MFFHCVLDPSSPVPGQQTSSDARVASRINQIMPTRQASADFSGTVLVARRGKVIYDHALGWQIESGISPRTQKQSMPIARRDTNAPRPACKTHATTTCLFLTLQARSTRRSEISNLWDQALYGERLLPAKLRDRLFTPNLDNHGYGWGLLIPSPGSPYAGEPFACTEAPFLDFSR